MGLNQRMKAHACTKGIESKEPAMKEKKVSNGVGYEKSPDCSSLQSDSINTSEQEELYILPGSREMEEELERIERDKERAPLPLSGAILQGGTSGVLKIYAVPNPTSWQDTQSESSRWLDLTFDGAEWDAVFYDTFGLPKLDIKAGAEGHDLIAHRYPMLSRIDDMYEDVIYKREEIEQLRAECLKVQEIAKSPLAVKGLQTLISACDEALKLSTGLYLASD